MLQGNKYKIGSIANINPQARRGGIVTLYRLGVVSIESVYEAQATLNVLHVTFDSDKHQ